MIEVTLLAPPTTTLALNPVPAPSDDICVRLTGYVPATKLEVAVTVSVLLILIFPKLVT